MKKVIALCIVMVPLIAGCVGMPSIDQCDKVRYERDGMNYSVTFSQCRVKTQDSIIGNLR